jgi:hypothetical protein
MPRGCTLGIVFPGTVLLMVVALERPGATGAPVAMRAVGASARAELMVAEPAAAGADCIAIPLVQDVPFAAGTPLATDIPFAAGIPLIADMAAGMLGVPGTMSDCPAWSCIATAGPFTSMSVDGVVAYRRAMEFSVSPACTEYTINDRPIVGELLGSAARAEAGGFSENGS